jgi:predicted NAD/FAD-binding protein
MFSVWVNAVEPTLHGQSPIFQTWNPLFEPQPDQVISRTALSRAVVDHESQRALQTLETLHAETGRQVFFAGSWASMGIPLLESAVQSAMRVAQHLQVPISFGSEYSSADI